MPIPSDKKLLEQWDRHRNISEGDLNLQHNLAREAHLYNAGDEALYRAGVQEKTAKNQVVFNKIKPFVDSVAGMMTQLRRKPFYMARVEESQEQEARSSYMNSLSDYVRKNANMDSLESRQNREMLIAGYGAIDSNILYERNPDGEVCGELVRYSDVFWDPQAQEPNLLDSRWTYRRKAFGLKEALKRFKGSTEEEFERYNPDKNIGYYYLPGGEYDKISAEGTQEEDLVEVNYYQWWQLDKYYRAVNPLFDEELELEPAQASMLAQLMVNIKENRAEVAKEKDVDDIFDFDPFAEFLIMTPIIRNDLRVLFRKFGIEIEEQEYLRRVYYTAIISGTTVFQKFKSPDQQGFTIKFKTACYDPVRRTWYGMVAGMINPARYANKALSEILYAIAAQSKGGVMYEKSAVDDPPRFEQQYATTKAAIRVNDGALSGGKIQDKARSHLQTGYEQVYQVADQSIEQTSGVSKEFLGTSGAKQVSALLEAQRINQVMASLADYFDSISLYQLESARLMTTYIRMLAENSEGRLVSILGENGARGYERLSLSKLADEYDIDIGEAPTTPVQQQETAKVTLELADKLFSAGQNIYPLVVDYLPGIKETDKARIKQAMQPSPEQVEAQQRAIAQNEEMERALKASVIKFQESQAVKNVADAGRIQAQTDETTAKTAKTLQEASKEALETQLLRERPPETIDATI